jgi:hypothetical protein
MNISWHYETQDMLFLALYPVSKGKTHLGMKLGTLSIDFQQIDRDGGWQWSQPQFEKLIECCWLVNPHCILPYIAIG